MNRAGHPGLGAISPSWKIRVLTVGIVVVATVSAPRALDWEIEFVDGPMWFDEMSERSLCIDSDGHPHVVYWGNCVSWGEPVGRQIHYAHHDGESWHLELVNGDSTRKYDASLVVDGSGSPHICYSVSFEDGSVGHSLLYATKGPSGWWNEIVDRRASGPCIDVDSENRPHICYRGFDGSLKLMYGYRDENEWHTSSVLSEFSGYYLPSMRLDDSNRPHIAYRPSGIKYAHKGESGWVVDQICDEASSSPSLSLEQQGLPHIMYSIGYPAEYALGHAYWTGSEWIVDTIPIGVGSRGISCAVDAEGHVHAGYQSSRHLYYALFDGSSWNIESVGVTGEPGCISLDVDSSGEPWVAFTKRQSYSSIHEARLAHRTGESAWLTEVIDREQDLGLWSSVGLSPDGLPNMAYQEHFSGDLKYASWNGFTWTVEAVDTQGDAGAGAALAVDTMGLPSIVYYSDNNVKYAQNDGEHWIVETISKDAYLNYPPGRTSIAIDVELRPHVAYCTTQSYLDSVKCATRDGIDWTIVTVDQGRSPSMTLDSESRPHLIYQSYYPSNRLLYAYLDGPLWHRGVVDSGIYGGHPSVALDSAGNPHISYCLGGYGAERQGLWYACDDGSGWRIEEVDGWPGVGRYSSIDLDDLDRPHICYSQEGGGQDLRFAWKDGAIWHITIIDDSYQVGQYCSIALDNQNHRHVSYYDPRTRALKYAFSTGEGLWTDSPLPNFTSLQLRIEGPVPCPGYARVALILPIQTSVRVSVCDLMGRQSRDVHHGQLSEGEHRFVWNGADDRGHCAPNGTYIISAKAGGERVSKRIVLLR